MKRVGGVEERHSDGTKNRTGGGGKKIKKDRRQGLVTGMFVCGAPRGPASLEKDTGLSNQREGEKRHLSKSYFKFEKIQQCRTLGWVSCLSNSTYKRIRNIFLVPRGRTTAKRTIMEREQALLIVFRKKVNWDRENKNKKHDLMCVVLPETFCLYHFNAVKIEMALRS